MALRNHFKLTIFTAWTLLNSDSFRIHLQTRAVFQLETYADGQLDFLLVHYMRVFTKQLLIDQARDRKELLFFKLLQRNGFLSVLSDYAVQCYMGCAWICRGSQLQTECQVLCGLLGQCFCGSQYLGVDHRIRYIETSSLWHRVFAVNTV